MPQNANEALAALFQDDLVTIYDAASSLRAVPDGYNPERVEALASETVTAMEAMWAKLGLSSCELWDAVSSRTDVRPHWDKSHQPYAAGEGR